MISKNNMILLFRFSFSIVWTGEPNVIESRSEAGYKNVKIRVVFVRLFKKDTMWSQTPAIIGFN